MSRSALSQESLSPLLTAFQQMEDYDARGEGFKRALIGEQVDLVAMLGAPQKLVELSGAPGFDLPAETRNQVMTRLQKAGKLTAEQEFCEETFRQVMSIRQTAFPARLKAGDLIRERVTKAAAQKQAIMVWLLPGLASHVMKEAECLASLRQGLTAVALEEFRVAGGNCYPDDLSKLTPKYLASLPVDPFDGQPLRYRKRGGGYLLYSIGPDLKDDSGERLKERTGDIVFEVADPAKPRT